MEHGELGNSTATEGFTAVVVRWEGARKVYELVIAALAETLRQALGLALAKCKS